MLRHNQCYPVEHLITGENQFYNNNNNNNNNNNDNNNNDDDDSDDDNNNNNNTAFAFPCGYAQMRITIKVKNLP